jgi:hypothetical protein
VYTWKHRELSKGDKVAWKENIRGRFYFKEGVVLAYIPSDEKISDIVPELKTGKCLHGRKILQISLCDRYAVLLTKADGKVLEGYFAFPPCKRVEDCMRNLKPSKP